MIKKFFKLLLLLVVFISRSDAKIIKDNNLERDIKVINNNLKDIKTKLSDKSYYLSYFAPEIVEFTKCFLDFVDKFHKGNFSLSQARDLLDILIKINQKLEEIDKQPKSKVSLEERKKDLVKDLKDYSVKYKINKNKNILEF